MSRNMCKLRHKLRNSKKILLEVQISEIIFFQAINQTILDIFSQILDHITKTVFSNLFLLFFTLSFKMYRNMCKLRYKLRNVKNLVALRRDIGLKWHLVGKYAVSNDIFENIIEVPI